MCFRDMEPWPHGSSYNVLIETWGFNQLQVSLQKDGFLVPGADYLEDHPRTCK